MVTCRKLSVAQCTVISLLLAALSLLCKAAPGEAAAPAENLQIERIETAGNVTIEQNLIFSAIRTRKGDLFDPGLAGEDVKRIGRIDGVEYAYYNTKTEDGRIVLTYVVVEKNLIRTLVFEGNKGISTAKLTKELGVKIGDYLDPFVAANGVEVLTKYYIKKGYASVQVTLDQTGLAVGRLGYGINEGPRVKIAKVTLTGNTGLKTGQLMKIIKVRKTKFFFWSVYYQQQQLDDDAAKILGIYQDRGYLDCKVDVETAFAADKKSVKVSFIIDEGPQYLVADVDVRGNQFFDDLAIRSVMKLQPGDFYSKAKAEYDIRHIRSLYLEKGFVDVKIEHARTYAGPAKVSAAFNVIEGRRYRIGQVIITGNEAVKDNVIRRVLDEENFKPGEWFNADVARGDGTGELEKIVRKTIFTESANISAVGNKPDSRDAQVSIAEGQTGSIMLGAGIASDSGVMGQIVFDQRNFDITDWPESMGELIVGKAFKGAGQRLRISLNPGTVQSTFSISFTEPYLYDKPVALDLVASGYARGRESYDEDRLRGYVGFEKRYPDRWRRGIGFRAESVDISSLDPDAPQEIWDVKGGNTLFGAKFYVRRETTDSRFTPSKGYIFDVGYEQVGGDYTFGMLEATQRWYKTLYQDLAERKTILETKIHGASILGDAPPFEKFYAGGTGSLRGFDYRGVSTRGWQTNVANPERKDPIGSKWIILGNAEVAVPLGSEVFSALFFVDAGAIDSGGIRAGIGTGIQILLPQWFGPVPMRFELAAPVMKESEDETRIFSFSVGALF